jgi:protein tyrosine phosphatase (PTP) superfamily phosphohydrolase (DUF442 family)
LNPFKLKHATKLSGDYVIMSAENNSEATHLAAPGKRRRRLKFYGFRLLLVVVMAVLGVGAFVLYLLSQSNFHVVSEGKVYRSAQMNVADLRQVVQAHGIRTILNLRGPAEGAKGLWYNAETNLSQELGVQHFDFALLAGRELKDEEMDQILMTMSNAPKPILIHCKSGSDRTGLVGALYLYSLEGKPPEAAARELTVFCGHVPYLFWRDTIAMDRSYWRYVGNHARVTER